MRSTAQKRQAAGLAALQWVMRSVAVDGGRLALRLMCVVYVRTLRLKVDISGIGDERAMRLRPWTSGLYLQLPY